MRGDRSRISATALVLAVGLLVGALPVTARGESVPRQSGSFVDDDGHPAEVAFEYLAGLGVIHGCDPPANARVCPDRILTRAEASKILVRLGQEHGLLAGSRPGDFDHFVDDDLTWEGAAETFIDHLADLGIVHGCDPPVNVHFCPDAPLQRGQIAKMVVRALDLDAPDGFVSPWTDTAGQFYHRAARIGAYHGLWDDSVGRFGGHDQVSRAEFARVVAVAVKADPCPQDPFTAANEEWLDTNYPGKSFTAYAFDVSSRCAYWLNPGNRQPTASVFKVMVMAGTLLEAQQAGREPSGYELGQMEPMITESANPPVRSLWSSFGAAPWFETQVEIFQLDQTTALGDHGEPWGRTRTSGLDQADLLRQVLLGEWGPLDADSRAVAHDLMTSVVDSQTWGVTAGVPDTWTVAQKNGFAGPHTNSVGVVYDDLGEPRYVVAILTTGWASYPEGIPVVESISEWVAATLG